ncbi:MAG: hypothetical protein U0324_31360 [Polyangiales bacterium]
MAGTPRTAWHYFLHMLLRERGPKRFEYLAEEPLTKDWQRMDWLVVRRRARAAHDPGTTLVKLWPRLPKVSVFEFKSASKGYRARGLHRLLGYGHQYFSERESDLPSPADLALVLLVARRYEALDDDLRDLSLREEPLSAGYARVHGAAFPLLLVDLRALASQEGDDLIALFADGIPPSPAADAWWYAHCGRKDDNMDPRQLEDFEDMERRFFASIPLERRLAGATPAEIVACLKPESLALLPPEQRLAGIAPEDLARALTEADHVLALPDAALRALPADYLATLPEAAQERIRRRLGR